MFGKINVVMKDDFTVLDLNGQRKAGITLTEFTKGLYNPSGTEVSGSIPVTITDLGNGNYRASYTPNVSGLWKLIVFHSTYFSQGKENSHQIYDGDMDDVKFLRDIEGGRWKIISNQMIFYKEDNATEVARFNLFKLGAPSMDSPDERVRV